MRPAVAAVLIAGSLSLPVIASQSGGGAAGQPIRVCSILTRELAIKVSTPEGRVQIERTKPIENPVPNTTSCQVGRVMLVVDAFPKPNTRGGIWASSGNRFPASVTQRFIGAPINFATCTSSPRRTIFRSRSPKGRNPMMS
jgi:hypothetical protein